MKPAIPPTFPKAFIERYKAVFAENDFISVLRGFDAARQTWFRVNTLKSTVDGAFGALDRLGLEYGRDVRFPDAGWVAAGEREGLLASGPVEDGHIYVQGFASQLPVRFLDVVPGLKVLDLAAAPGSKTLQLAGLLSPDDELAAVELVRKRKFKLQDNLNRNGAGMVRVFHQDGTKVWKYRPEYFDRVLLDAPCSSEGRFRLDDESSFGFWSPSKVKEMVRKQRRLLFSAVHALKPGGTLVYSTCALSPEENEGVIQHALTSFGESLRVEAIDFEAPERMAVVSNWRNKEIDASIHGACRLLPSERMEGFFLCKLKKTASSNPPVPERRR